MRKPRPVQPRPNVEQLLDRAVGELDQLVGEVRGGIRSQAHFADLEERATAIGRQIRGAFREGAR